MQRGDHQVTRNSSLFKRVGLNASHEEVEDSESESDSEYNPRPQQESPETPTTLTHNPPPPASPRRNPLRKKLPPTKLKNFVVG